MTENLIFGQFDVVSLNLYFFLRAGWFHHVCKFNQEYSNEKTSSLADVSEELFKLLQKHRFWPFLAT